MSRSFLIRFTTISAVYAYQDQQYSLSINYIGIRIYTSVIHRCIGVLFVYSKNRRRTRRTPTPTLAHPPLEHHSFGDLVMKIHVVNSKIRLSSISFMFRQCEKKRDIYPHSLLTFGGRKRISTSTSSSSSPRAPPSLYLQTDIPRPKTSTRFQWDIITRASRKTRPGGRRPHPLLLPPLALLKLHKAPN